LAKYRGKGLRLTPQRLAVLGCLDGNKSHPSAEDIYGEVKKRFPTMSFATVYNTLETLWKRGRILQLSVDPERKRYDPNTTYHHHLICTKCKKIVDVHGNFQMSIPDEQKGAFEVIGNHIEFYGICPECKNKGGTKGSSFYMKRHK
jgi:Fur family peroxide stress response transcriptional regulator